jgi:hypothetical protein
LVLFGRLTFHLDGSLCELQIEQAVLCILEDADTGRLDIDVVVAEQQMVYIATEMVQKAHRVPGSHPLHVAVATLLVEDVAVLISDDNLPAEIVGDLQLDCNPLVVRDKERLCSRFVVVFGSKEMDLRHIDLLKVQHEDLIDEEDIAI